MSGTKEGGAKAAATNRARHGDDFYAKIGGKGGRNSNTGGFASGKVGKDGLTGKERAAIVGAKGGSLSRRHGSVYKPQWDECHDLIEKMLKLGVPKTKVAKKVGIPYKAFAYLARKENI